MARAHTTAAAAAALLAGFLWVAAVHGQGQTCATESVTLALSSGDACANRSQIVDCWATLTVTIDASCNATLQPGAATASDGTPCLPVAAVVKPGGRALRGSVIIDSQAWPLTLNSVGPTLVFARVGKKWGKEKTAADVQAEQARDQASKKKGKGSPDCLLPFEAVSGQIFASQLRGVNGAGRRGAAAGSNEPLVASASA